LLFLFNIFGFGVVMTLYCILDLILTQSSPRLPNISHSSIFHLKSLPISLAAGFILPTVLISLPSFSTETHQQLMIF
jgi:hypothetical protein